MFYVHIRAFLSLPTCLWRIEVEFLIADSGLCHLKLLFVPWRLEEEEQKESDKEPERKCGVFCVHIRRFLSLLNCLWRGEEKLLIAPLLRVFT